jgi:hypothetical protein
MPVESAWWLDADLTHRRSGWLLAGSLLGVNVTALFIYNLTGEFGPFHVFAIVS